MRISKRTRELAAQLCSMAACSQTMRMYSVADAMQYRALSPHRVLAFEALAEVNRSIPSGSPTNRYAEAEALLRTGWSP